MASGPALDVMASRNLARSITLELHHMLNVKAEVKGNTLILTVDLSQRNGLSSTGKNETVASTKGNASVPGHAGIKYGLNVYAAPGSR